jgi:membrane fusion protein (multidrug efflux system)
MSSETENESNESRASKKPIIIGLFVLLLLATGGYLYYLHARNYVSTDDAYTTGDIHQISARIPSSVTAVAVVDNQLVKQGDLLVTLDPREFEIAIQTAQAVSAQGHAKVAQAEAAILLSNANELTSGANVSTAEATGKQAAARMALAKISYDRAISISQSNPGAISQSTVDTAAEQMKEAESEVAAAAAAFRAAQAQVIASRAKTSSAKTDLDAARASEQSAEAQVAMAKLNLEFTKITAPVAGKISKKSVEVGQRLSPGQPLMAIVPQNVWVVSNLKETQLADVKIGQSVKVEVDAIPDFVFDGKIDSIQEGSGSTFSLLPSDNAIGNFTKIVQRVPVKIIIDSKQLESHRDRLVPGLSVVATIDLRSGSESHDHD